MIIIMASSFLYLKFIQILFEGIHASNPNTGAKNMSHELFMVSFATNESTSEIVTITISQKYPIGCWSTNGDALWYHLKAQGTAPNETCLISFHPTMYYGTNKQILSSIQVSQCPIEIIDASKCNVDHFSGSVTACNILKFNVSIDAKSKEIMMLKHDLNHSSNDLKDNAVQSKVM